MYSQRSGRKLLKIRIKPVICASAPKNPIFIIIKIIPLKYTIDPLIFPKTIVRFLPFLVKNLIEPANPTKKQSPARKNSFFITRVHSIVEEMIWQRKAVFPRNTKLLKLAEAPTRFLIRHPVTFVIVEVEELKHSMQLLKKIITNQKVNIHQEQYSTYRHICLRQNKENSCDKEKYASCHLLCQKLLRQFVIIIQLDMSISYQFSNNSNLRQVEMKQNENTSSKSIEGQSNPSLVTSQSSKQIAYVFKVVNPQDRTINKGKKVIQNKKIDKMNSSDLKDVQFRMKPYLNQSVTPSYKKSTLFEKQTTNQEDLMKGKLLSLQKQNQLLKKENISLNQIIASLKQREEKLLKDISNSQITSLKQQTKQLQLQIQKIKNQYIQTSLDCFNDALRPQLQKIIDLKSMLEAEKQKNQNLYLQLDESKRKVQYYQKELELKRKIFEVQMRSSKQRFEIKLSDKDNTIKELNHSLQTLRQRYQVCVSEIKFKDEFLYKLKEQRQRKPSI